MFLRSLFSVIKLIPRYSKSQTLLPKHINDAALILWVPLTHNIIMFNTNGNLFVSNFPASSSSPVTGIPVQIPERGQARPYLCQFEITRCASTVELPLLRTRHHQQSQEDKHRQVQNPARCVSNQQSEL